jgi:TPR repeat protein
MKQYYSCCGKNICGGCFYSFYQSRNLEHCPFCKSKKSEKSEITDKETIQEMMKRVEANDARSIYVLGSFYHHGQLGLQQDRIKAKELWIQAAELGSSQAIITWVICIMRGGI